MQAKDYLKLPYMRALLRDEETATFTARVLEFPGCIAQGATVAEAYEQLEKVAESWIDVALEMGQEIPEPAQNVSCSGRIALRLPKTLHQQVVQQAEMEGVSINQYLVYAISEKVARTSAITGLRQLFSDHMKQFSDTATSSANLPVVNVVLVPGSDTDSYPTFNFPEKVKVPNWESFNVQKVIRSFSAATHEMKRGQKPGRKLTA